MARAILRIDDWYIEWSTVCDAPTSFGMRRAEMLDYLTSDGTDVGVAEQRLARADATGASWLDGSSAEEWIAGNRAGPREAELSREELVRWYCVEQREPDAA